MHLMEASIRLHETMQRNQEFMRMNYRRIDENYPGPPGLVSE